MATRRTFIGTGLSAAAFLANQRGFANAGGEATDPVDLTLERAAQAVRTRGISPLELTRAYLARIERLDPQVNAFITVAAERALEQARQLEAELMRGTWRGPLHGIPIALKDNIDTAGIRTTAASSIFAHRVPAESAEVQRRLEEAGAVLLGKLNLHEWAYGGTSAISHFGPVHNPWNLGHIPGGSSGGSAAAVAARLCCAALGTDTLASIRLPAAYCGVVGLKATHGLASIRGIIPVSESLDHVGPLARTVVDAALVLQAIAGYDALDPSSIRAELPDYARAAAEITGPLRLGIPRTPYFDRLDVDVSAAVNEAVRVVGELATEVREVTLPEPPNFGVLLAEAYAYHQPMLDDPATRAQYNPVTLERLLAAGEVPAAAYIKVRRELELVRRAIAAVFSQVDVLVTPTAPGLPETIGNAVNPAAASGAEPSVRNTAPFNLYGIPTISVPCGFSHSGLPIGLQISGPHLGEVPVLALAHAYQQVTAWHTRTPQLYSR